MNFGQAIASGFSNYVAFAGRACRSELWVLFTLIGGLATGILDAAVFSSLGPTSSPLNGIFDAEPCPEREASARHQPERLVDPYRINHRWDTRAALLGVQERHGGSEQVRPGSFGGVGGLDFSPRLTI